MQTLGPDSPKSLHRPLNEHFKELNPERDLVKPIVPFEGALKGSP